MNIRSLSFGGLPAACLSSRSTGSIFDHSASLTSKRSARLTPSRNRVLRGAGVTPAAKRTQGACRPRDGASKVRYSRSRRGQRSGRHQRRSRRGPGPAHRRGPGAWHVREDRPGIWEASSSPSQERRCGRRARNRPGPRGSASGPGGAKGGANGGTAERRRRSEAGGKARCLPSRSLCPQNRVAGVGAGR